MSNTHSIKIYDTFGVLKRTFTVLSSRDLRQPNVDYTIGQPRINSLLAKPGILPVLKSQFPEFVSQDHPRFINFIKSYYTWLESKGNPLYDSQRIKEYQDIDTSSEVYTEQFFKEFMVDIPRSILVDKATLLKNIRNFYRAKGTEKSYKLFFRMLYNLNVEFYYPRKDMLKASDGKWIQDITLRVTSVQKIDEGGNLLENPDGTPMPFGNPLLLKGVKITGLSKNSMAFVERVNLIRQGNKDGYELLLNRSSITGNFFIDEEIQGFFKDSFGNLTEIRAKINAIPTRVQILPNLPGAGYVEGQIMEINNSTTGAGGTVVKITRVGENGEILDLQIDSYGFGWDQTQDDQFVSMIPFYNPQNPPSILGYFKLSFGALANYPGYYFNDDGQLSAEKYIQDGEFYQQFSYVLFTDLSAKDYKEDLKRLVHPVGLKLFGGFRTQLKIPTKIKYAKRSSGDLRLLIVNRFKAPLYVKNTVKLIINVIQSTISARLGSTLGSIENYAFKFKPYQNYDANKEFTQKNANYFGTTNDLTDQLAVTPISDFDFYGITPGQIIEHKYQPCNVQPDSVIISRNLDDFDYSI